jgi:hypothetical protein
MVFSLLTLFAPAQKALAVEGEMQWAQQPLPTANYFVLDNGSNAADVAIGPDGKTIYAIDSAAAANAVGSVLKSWDGGQSFVAITAPGAGANTFALVAVAPDDPNVAALVERFAAAQDVIWVTTNGGITWTALAALPVLATGNVRGVAISPARYDSLLGRDFVVAYQDTAAAGYSGVNGLEVMGATPATAWVAFGTAACDYLAVTLSPNYLADHAVLAVQTNVGGTAVEVWNNTEPAGAPVLYPTTVAFPRIINAGAVEAIAAAEAADNATPINFDPTVPSGMRFWVGVASSVAEPGVGAGGVYRVDAAQTPELLNTGLIGTRVNSVAYSGDTSTGTLFIGVQTAVGLTAPVSWTTQASTNLPVFNPSLKSPTGNGGRPVVRLSPNFGADKTAYAVSTGVESAFSISTDAGVSFNQEAIIDDAAANIANIDDMTMTADGKTLFIVSRSAAGNVSLWKTASGPTDTSWSRIFCAALTVNARCRIAINKGEWATAPEIYIVDQNLAAGAGGNQLFASYDGGATYNNRLSAFLRTDSIGVASSKTIFVASNNAAAASTTVSKSTNGGSVWQPPQPGNAGAIATVVPFGPNVLVGGTGVVSLSTNAGLTFTTLSQPGLVAGTLYGCIPDGNNATNNLVYAFPLNTATNVMRLNVATGTAWDNLGNTAAANISFGGGGTKGGLYAIQAGSFDRSINPADPVGTITWGVANVLAPGGEGRGTVSANKVYTANAGPGAPDLWAYNDAMANAKTTFTSPAGGTVVPMDPVTGRASPLIVAWSPIGTSTGLARNYQFFIFETAAGPGAANFAATGVLLGPQLTSPRCVIWPSGPSGVPGVLAPDFVYTFVSGTQYTLMIRAIDEISTDGLFSAWSDSVTFSIEAGGAPITSPHGGPLLNAPSLNASAAGLEVALSWAPVYGATEYEVVIATDAALTKVVGGTPKLVTTASYGTTLSFDTLYYYGVKATKPTVGVQSADTFTKAKAAAQVWTAPNGLTFNSRAELDAYLAANAPTTPAYVWGIIAIGAILVIVVIFLIVSTRKVS